MDPEPTQTTDIIKPTPSVRYQCTLCTGHFTKYNQTKHQKTQRHIKAMNPVTTDL